MAKRRKKGLSGLGEIPRELKPIVPSDLKSYQLQKIAFRDELKDRRCPLALDLLTSAASWAGTARARAVQKGTDGGASELMADVDGMRQEYLKVCLDWTDKDTAALLEKGSAKKPSRKKKTA